MTAPHGPVRYAVVGTGWRSTFFLRLARALPQRFAVTGVVTRSAERAAAVEADWSVPTARTAEELLARERPEFVVVSVPRDVAAAVTTDLVGRGVAVLTETPPAADADGLRALWAAVGGQDRVAVAEQYLMMPGHAARRAVAASGVIGEVTSVHVSSTHDYHAVSMVRGLLGAGFADAEVRAGAFAAPLVDPVARDGWTGDPLPRPATTTLATLDFGGGRSGLYDFTDGQWHNPLRSRRILVRGSHGEIRDDAVVRVVDARTVVESPLVRRQTGVDLNLEGFDLDHVSHDGVVVYRNPFAGARLADEDIAIATLLDRTGAWARGLGPTPYSLADACQDHLLGLAIGESRRTGAPVRTGREAWAG